MVLKFSGQKDIKNMFPHSKRYDQGLGTEQIRKGKSQIIISKDGSGDFETISEGLKNIEEGKEIIVKDGTYNENIELSTDNIRVKGNGYSSFISGKITISAKRCVVSDVRVSNNPWIEITGNRNIVERCYCDGNGEIQIKSGARFNHIRNNYLETGHTFIIKITDSSYNYISRNISYETASTEAFVYIEGADSSNICRGNQIINNTIIGTDIPTNPGIGGHVKLWDYTEDTFISGNFFQNSEEMAVWVRNHSKRTRIIGNHFVDIGRSSSVSVGILIDPDSSEGENIILGNEIRNINEYSASGGDGIKIKTGSTDNIVTNNIIKNYDGTAIIDNGTTTTQANNIT